MGHTGRLSPSNINLRSSRQDLLGCAPFHPRAPSHCVEVRFILECAPLEYWQVLRYVTDIVFRWCIFPNVVALIWITTGAFGKDIAERMCVGYLFATQHREKGNSCKAGVIFHAMLQRWPWFSWEGGKHITWETPAPTFSLTTSRQSLFLHFWNAALDLYGMRSQVLWLNLGSFDEYHCTSQRCIWLITYPRRGRSLIGRDTAQQLRGRPVRWQNKSTLSLWFLSLHFVSLSRLVLLLWVLFCFSYDLPWVWSQHIVLELPRFCDLMFLLCILIFPFVSFVLFCCFLGSFSFVFIC